MNQEFISVGGTPYPSASAWDKGSGILAFGAGRVVALWKPNVPRTGVFGTLKGHEGKVNALNFLPNRANGHEIIISGSEDRSIKAWNLNRARNNYKPLLSVSAHAGSITSIHAEQLGKADTGMGSSAYILASSSSDGSVRIWKLNGLSSDESSNALANLEKTDTKSPELKCFQEIVTKPRYFPLAVALSRFKLKNGERSAMILAIAGTTASIDIYIADSAFSSEAPFLHVATLAGHENWVRSLSFVCERKGNADPSLGEPPDILLASGSQDKYIRLWRFRKGVKLPERIKNTIKIDMGRSLSNKAHMFRAEGEDYTITFEALLVGHDDWVYTTQWDSQGGIGDSPQDAVPLRLLSASADNSLTIWQQDQATGIWVSISRLGQINVTKGASTATGSTGGFWAGLWAPDGRSVVALGKTGSWRMWKHEQDSSWRQTIAIGGHVRDVTGVAWEPEGRFLLSTSLDQTTRLFSQWRSYSTTSWHEFSRPQIHGYDINCVAFVGANRFVSGADEKLLRVFDEPKVTASLLENLCNVQGISRDLMPDAASVPALGLSNKVQDSEDSGLLKAEGDSDGSSTGIQNDNGLLSNSDLGPSHPPLEDDLSRHTLWPETEKLYGHGFEISAVAGSHDGRILATACKASSLDYAVIRLYDCQGWRQLIPPLKTHALTINRLAFSNDDQFLLSVGRDRQWAIAKRVPGTTGNADSFQVHSVMPKAHSRIIWDGSWAPHSTKRMIATASRDKTVKIWQQQEDDETQWSCTSTLKFDNAVKAVAFYHDYIRLNDKNSFMLGIGLENGDLCVYRGEVDSRQEVHEWKLVISALPSATPDKSITQIAWQPGIREENSQRYEMAVGSEDSSLRIYSFKREDII